MRINVCFAASISTPGSTSSNRTTSKIAPHSIASPLAIAYRFARSAALGFPTPSAMFIGIDVAARRH
ncbi:MAG TPA: hypothetical protein VGG74_28490 [Kofleriaceae bacterium]